MGLAPALPAALLLAPLAALADDSQLVAQVANEALAVARAGGSPSRFRSILMRYSAYQGVAMFALGRYRSQLPPGQRDRYVTLATNYVASTFARNAKSFAVDWRVQKGKIIDVNIQGVWLTLQLRDQFTGVLGRSNGDFDALFRFLQSNRPG